MTDRRYFYVVMFFIGMLVGGMFVNTFQMNTIVAAVEEIRSSENEMCENVWYLLDKGLE